MDIEYLSCRMDYELKTMNTELDDQAMNNQTYQIFGSMMGHKPDFMRQWLRYFTVTNKHYVSSIAPTYFKLKRLKLSIWLDGVKTRKRADILAVFLLCKAMDMHCFIYLKDNKFWTTLCDDTNDHKDYMEKCNLHLCYLGNGTFTELTLHTEPIQYTIFGIPEPIQVEGKLNLLLLVHSQLMKIKHWIY